MRYPANCGRAIVSLLVNEEDMHMELSRYQFEILAFLEKKEMRTHSIRALSDAIKISGNTVSSSPDGSI